MDTLTKKIYSREAILRDKMAQKILKYWGVRGNYQGILAYKEGTTWLFDDLDKDVIEEPFVMGGNDFITYIAEEEAELVVLEFSSATEKGSNYDEIRLIRHTDGWSYYSHRSFPGEISLCPVLLKYFKKAPERIYFKIFVC